MKLGIPTKSEKLQQISIEQLVTELLRRNETLAKVDEDSRKYGEEGFHPEYLSGFLSATFFVLTAFGYELRTAPEKEQTK